MARPPRDGRVDPERLVPSGELREPPGAFLRQRERLASAAVQDHPDDPTLERDRAFSTLAGSHVETLARGSGPPGRSLPPEPGTSFRSP